MKRQMTEAEVDRVKRAQAGIDAVLEKFNVSLYPMVTITAEGTNFQVGIIPNPEEKRIIVPKIKEDAIKQRVLGGGK